MTLDIMMPFYGQVDHFRAAVESVRAQSDPDWRLVVIDDAYPDLSAGEWLVGLGDERIEYVRNVENLGINANFQKSIDLARSEWMTIFGCDDILLPGYVKRLRSLTESAPAGFVQPGVRVIDDTGTPSTTLVDRAKDLYRPRFKGTVTLGGERLATSLMRGNWMYFPALCWRRKLIAAHGFRPDLLTIQDLALAIDILLDGAELTVDDMVVFEYRRHAASVSSWRAADGSRFLEEQRFFSRVAGEFRDRGWRRAASAARLHLSSRINAITRVPGALRNGGAGVGTLTRYALGMSVEA